MTTFYIAGPMRGYDQFNFPMFDRCAADLREWAHKAISPAEHDRENGFDETLNSLDGFDMNRALLWDLEQIALHADAVVLLPGWEKSSGVAAELACARALGKQAYTWNPDHADHSGMYMLDPLPSSWTPSNEHEINQALAEPEIRVTDPNTGGQKGSKLARFDLLPPDALWQLAEHYGKGAEKYDAHNWRRGYAWSLTFAALMRHAWSFWNGENVDPETGSLHMTAAAWHAFTLITFARCGLGTDDRPVAQVPR